MNLEIEILTARAALPRAERGASVEFIASYLAGRTLNIPTAQGVFRSVHATAHGLMVFVTTATGRSASAPLASATIA